VVLQLEKFVKSCSRAAAETIGSVLGDSTFRLCGHVRNAVQLGRRYYGGYLMARQSRAVQAAEDRNFHEISASQWPGLAMDAVADTRYSRNMWTYTDMLPDALEGQFYRLMTPRYYVTKNSDERDHLVKTLGHAWQTATSSSCRSGGARH